MKRLGLTIILLLITVVRGHGAISVTCPAPSGGNSLCSCSDLPGEIDGPAGGATCGTQTCLPSGYCFPSSVEGCNFSNCVYGCSTDCDCPFSTLTCGGSGYCVPGVNRGCSSPGSCDQDCAAAGYEGYEHYGITPGYCMVHNILGTYPDGYCPTNSVMPLGSHTPAFDHDCPVYPRIGISWCCCNGPMGNCTSDAQCTGGKVCNLVTNRCVQCNTNAECSAGQFCTNNQCGGCTTDSQCSPNICNPVTGGCVQCNSNTDCSGGQVCLSNTCQPCTSDAQCGGGFTCQSGSCVGVPAGTITTSAPSCTASPSGTCTVSVNWTTSNVGSIPVNVWVNGVSFGGCQANGAGVPATIHSGVSYYFTLVTGPSACTSPLGGTPLAHATVLGVAATTGTCPPNSICGQVTSAETSGPLANVTLQLRDAAGGQVKQITKTATDGSYSFTGLAQPSYYVTPVVDRTQSSSPSQASVSVSFGANFVVRGVSTSLQFMNLSPGTIILLTPNTAYTAAAMPVVKPGTAAEASYYLVTSEADGTATTQVPAGKPYYYVCWKHVGSAGTYTRSTPASVSGAAPLAPNASITGLTCP